MESFACLSVIREKVFKAERRTSSGRGSRWPLRRQENDVQMTAYSEGREYDDNAEKEDLESIIMELEVMKSLRNHPHVVGLIGHCIEKDPVFIVLEYLPYGDLLGYLRKSRGIEDNYNTGEKEPSSALSEKDLLSFAWMIADGMDYLASMKVVHRDLAARNVLVGENRVCKISDFGLARSLQEDIYTRRTQARLPIKWMAPESIFNAESTTKSDVWSYGIVMWELFTLGGSPYPGVSVKELISLLEGAYRMPKPKHVSEKLYAIMMEECWNEQPQNRPTFKWIRYAVKRLQDDQQVYVNLEGYDDQEYLIII
ncbi:fibroblast growth factor receptor 2-like [Pocillopora verrucosa]|uniref:fibroblast growth factor receptor 2-like n=1 Tax=Pocillopora verrucosa TaxID=203993 RepID=UPI00334132BA